MKQYKILNNVVGWLMFAIAAFTYCSTVEPTASFWDCPEFITTAYKLEIGHPPGAPFFMLTGNFFTQFTDDPTKVALCINMMSALLSALCILFLFWSITHLGRKLYCEGGVPQNWKETLVVLVSGAVGALAYTWSDTFWYSAVEGEVYGYSSMFTALVFWLILKWEDHADEPHSDRWLVLIFYLTGLSIGVHLLNLLCLPAITLVYYYRRYPNANLKGSLLALALSGVILCAVLYGIVPGFVKVGGWFELLCVNTLGLPFNTGVVIYFCLLIGTVLTAIWSTLQHNRTLSVWLYIASVGLLGIPFYGEGVGAVLVGIIIMGLLYAALCIKVKDGNFLLRKRFLNTSLLCMLMVMIGYTTYAVTVVRSMQNTPMDQNSPEDIFSLGSYLARDQYGNRPLFYGEAYSSQEQAYWAGAVDYVKETIWTKKEKHSADEPDEYEGVEQTKSLDYPSGLKMLFPRIWDPRHQSNYEQWLGGHVDTKTVHFRTKEGLMTGEMPTQMENINFFLSYQVNFMYWRYFMWNFAGRQNDIPGYGELDHGNWITGFPVVDNALYGDQSLLPDVLKENKGHNVFYCLPLLLGLLGLFWQAFRDKRGVQQFWVVGFLFFMTGLAIVIYLNQTPSQPRERDYAYAGSFYAFAIWIGLGAMAIADLVRRYAPKAEMAGLVAAVLCLLVPVQMVSQTWDDHDRSGRYTCTEFGLNYLNTLPEKGNPIIFTNGDNETFPLWYNQEVEGKRTDARVCNLSYLQIDWYTDQMIRPAYDSPSLPITWERLYYVDNGKHSFYPIRDEKERLDQMKAENPDVDPYELSYVLDHFVKKEQGGYFPTDSLVVSLDKEAILESEMYLPCAPEEIPEKMEISLKKIKESRGGLYRSDVMIYELLARTNWRRPLYMTVTLGSSNFAGLENYCVLEGLAYRVTPFNFGHQRTIDTEKTYRNMMERFKYGNVNAPGIYLDESVGRMCMTHRHMFARLADALLQEASQAEKQGDEALAKEKREKARRALHKSKEMIPPTALPYTEDDLTLISLWDEVGEVKEAQSVARDLYKYALQYLDYINSLPYVRQQQFANTATFNVRNLIQCFQYLVKTGDPYVNKSDQLNGDMVKSPAFQMGYERLQ